VFLLSVRLRRREIEAMIKLGGSRLAVGSVLVSEVAAVRFMSVARAGSLTWLTSLFGARAVQALVLS
jgi:hypothetical protein